MFFEFFKQGFFHILNLNGADHILFLLSVCAIYSFKDYKKLLLIVTSFTIAHSLTLILSTLNIITVNTGFVEILIAATIVFTCIENLFIYSLHKYRPFITALFGLIHGIGFSFLLKQLFNGMEYKIRDTLLPFNLGLEMGQIIIVSFTLFGVGILSKKLKIPQQKINYLITLPTLCIAVCWLIKRIADYKI